jgi:hypothetical protein
MKGTKWPAIAMFMATVVMAVLLTLRDAMSDARIDASEWVLVVIAAFNIVTVWGAANIPGFEKAKTVMAATGVVLNLLVGYIVGGLTIDEIMLLAIHGLGALGVVVGPSPQHREVSAAARTVPPGHTY